MGAVGLQGRGRSGARISPGGDGKARAEARIRPGARPSEAHEADPEATPPVRSRSTSSASAKGSPIRSTPTSTISRTSRSFTVKSATIGRARCDYVSSIASLSSSLRPKHRQAFRARGYDLTRSSRATSTFNGAVRPALALTRVHFCRGNNQGKWLAGGYEAVAEEVFRLDAEALFSSTTPSAGDRTAGPRPERARGAGAVARRLRCSSPRTS
jgi:hypothetical protein